MNSVCDKAINTVNTEELYEPFHNHLSFIPIGVAPLGKKAENQWERYSFISYSQHKDIDIELSKLPVCTVHAQNKACFDRQQRVDHSGDNIEVKNILGEESLKPSEVGFLIDSGRHDICQLMEADSLYHHERMEQQSHKFDTRQIHRFSKMLLHNWKDLANFGQILGFSSFHREKLSNFFLKITNFQGLCKI